jgi:IS5 family transposase
MQKIAKLTREAGAKLRDRSRSIKYRILEIGRASRNKTEKGQEKLKTAYKKLLELTSRVVGQAKRYSQEIASGVRPKKKVDKAVLQRARQALDTMIPRVQQVMQQARVRVFKGNTHAEGKLLSVFEPNTEVIRKGKASKPTEFGKMAKIQEAENQIVTRYEVFDQRPSDSDLLVPAIEEHQRQLGCTPRVVAADAGFFSAAKGLSGNKCINFWAGDCSSSRHETCLS